MLTIHEMAFSRSCPVNDGIDHYNLTISTTKLVKVEDILAAVEKLPAKAFQEHLTSALASMLGVRVTTVGHHSGVKTTCTARG